MDRLSRRPRPVGPMEREKVVVEVSYQRVADWAGADPEESWEDE